MRLAAAILVLGAALVGALVLHGHRVNVIERDAAVGTGLTPPCYKPGHVYLKRVPPPCVSTKRRPGWVNPVALGICFLGLAGGAAVLTARRGDRA